MKFDVTFEVRFTPILDSVDEWLMMVPFTVEVYALDSGTAVLTCRGVESEGLMALLEAVRKAQVGISHALKEAVPGFEGRGLLWGDILAVDVRAVQ